MAGKMQTKREHNAKSAKEICMEKTDTGAEKIVQNGVAPFKVPSYSMSELLAAIPAHCFERSTSRSFFYVFQSVTLTILCGFASTYIDSSSKLAPAILGVPAEYSAYVASAVKWTAWTAYWFWQGLIMTGLWIIAHECGHQAFSPKKAINDSVGWVLHSILLVPYHSWRISHAKHHAATGHLTRDQVFVPRNRVERSLPALITPEQAAQKEIDYDSLLLGTDVPASFSEQLAELLEDAPLYNLFNIIVQQTFGWPMYLIRNASGQRQYPHLTNHFFPSSPIFEPRHFWQIVVSDIGLALVFAGLTFWGMTRSWAEVGKMYFVPYLCVNHWLVMITYLQHTDPKLPHYRENQNGEGWNFQRGALATMDRNLLGWIGPNLLHGICETHIAHHIVSRMPHYHAWEATAALKEYLGTDYNYCSQNMFVSLWRNYKACKFVESEGDVVFYKDAYGKAKCFPVEKLSTSSDSAIEGVKL